MPCDYKKYHPDWLTVIRPAILERAENKCEECKLENKSFGFRAQDGTFYHWWYIEEALEQYGHDLFDDVLKHHIAKDGKAKSKGTTIVLTIAHIDHDIKNNDYSNLKALCQRCHLLLDKDLHANNSKETRNKKKKQLKLDL